MGGSGVPVGGWLRRNPEKKKDIHSKFAALSLVFFSSYFWTYLDHKTQPFDVRQLLSQQPFFFHLLNLWSPKSPQKAVCMVPQCERALSGSFCLLLVFPYSFLLLYCTRTVRVLYSIKYIEWVSSERTDMDMQASFLLPPLSYPPFGAAFEIGHGLSSLSLSLPPSRSHWSSCLLSCLT